MDGHRTGAGDGPGNRIPLTGRLTSTTAGARVPNAYATSGRPMGEGNMIRRTGLVLLVSACGLAAFGCGGNDNAASTTTADPATSTSIANVGPTTTLSPKQTAANAYYFGILATTNPSEDAI